MFTVPIFARKQGSTKAIFKKNVIHVRPDKAVFLSFIYNDKSRRREKFSLQGRNLSSSYSWD